MTSGIIFYWLGWMLWVVVTFFMKKGRKRTFYACWILCMIMLSGLTLSVSGYPISLAFVALVIGMACFHTVARSLYLIFSGFTISLCYIAILFWEQITPVWLFLPRSILISLAITFLISILAKNFQDKMAIGVIGLSGGEMIHSIILSSYEIHETIGGFAFFDINFMMVAILVFLETIQMARIKLYSFQQSYKRSPASGNQMSAKNNC